MITVRDLIELLQKEDPDRIVICQKDAEGNGCSPLSKDFGINKYQDGEIGIEELTPELKKQHYSEEDVMTGGRKALVLYPT